MKLFIVSTYQQTLGLLKERDFAYAQSFPLNLYKINNFNKLKRWCRQILLLKDLVQYFPLVLLLLLRKKYCKWADGNRLELERHFPPHFPTKVVSTPAYKAPGPASGRLI